MEQLKHWFFEAASLNNGNRTATKGAIGIVASVGVPATTSLLNMEVWLRVISLLGGLIVVLLTIISLCFTVRYKWIHRKDKPNYENETTVN